MKKNICKLLCMNASVLLAATMLVGMILAGDTTSATDTATTTTTIRVAESCSITSTLDTPHIALLPAGIYSGNYNSDGHDYRNGIGKTTIKAFCNDSAGFSIYAIGYTNDTFGNNTLIGPDNNTIVTGTGTSGDTSNWAMKIGTVAGTYAPTLENGYGSFKAVPSIYDKVASFNSVTDLTNGSSITTTYAAYIASTQAPGTYNGKVKYTLVHPVDEAPLQPETTDPGKICYYANARTYEGTMGCQNVSSSVTLLASNFSREGYGFAGWSATFDYSDPTGFYGPQETITLNTADYSGANNGLSLYAHWIKSAGNIQGWTGCNSLASGAVTALTDQRDNETYAIAKLADGKCWMIENLRLESTNSDNSTGALAQGYGTSTTYGNFSGLADAETADKFSSTYSANTLYSNNGSNDTINIGTSNAAYRMPRYSNVNTPSTASDRPQNPTANSSTNSTSNAGMYSYGNYYTWHAAIADLNPNNTNNQSTTGTSLCPTGWHLPTGGGAYASDSTTEVNKTGYPATYREFYNLGYKIMNEVKTAYEDTPNGANSYYSSATTNTAGDTATKAFRKYPNNFVYSGDVYSGSVFNRGSLGLYWSSTAYSSNYAYYLYLYSSYVYPGTHHFYKYVGRAVRCLVSGA